MRVDETIDQRLLSLAQWPGSLDLELIHSRWYMIAGLVGKLFTEVNKYQ